LLLEPRKRLRVGSTLRRRVGSTLRLRVGSTLERRRLLRNLRAMDPLKMYVGNLPPNLPRLQLAEKLRPVSTNPIRPETYSSTLNSFFQHFPKPAKLSVV
jgi:hypothetical protein